ncbi:hypothetical protein Taro_007061 [Colocasia esculenta]|uniref:Uncharacterized protein n=1 Tax=Colocasia esculenta TaxID=4460 RepID=A0A843TX37_COLES|nr:hypothetical protein [Colocasia esculenta]
MEQEKTSSTSCFKKREVAGLPKEHAKKAVELLCLPAITPLQVRTSGRFMGITIGAMLEEVQVYDSSKYHRLGSDFLDTVDFDLDVTYVLLALTRAYRIKVLAWAKESISLIPPTALTEAECSRFLNTLSAAASGSDVSALTETLEELSDYHIAVPKRKIMS